MTGTRLVARRFGPAAAVLVHEAAPEPAPGPSDVVVRMTAAAINPSDLLTIGGAYPHRTTLPFVPGFDGVGVVVHSPDPRLPVGSRVLPLGSSGGWQSFKTLPASWCVRVPDDLDDDAAATAYVNPLTARLMVAEVAPRPGRAYAVNAAASAIGRMLVRILAAAGARPVAVVRSDRAAAALGGEPVADVVRADRLPRLAGGFEAVGGPDGAALVAAVEAGGPVLHYGLLSGLPLPPASPGGARVRLFRLRDRVHAASAAEREAAMATVFDDIRAGLSATPIAARHPLHTFASALAADAAPGRVGKILLMPAHSSPLRAVVPEFAR